MNCQRFQPIMHEYLEGTLSPGNVALAELHLASCAECRQAVRREQSLNASLSRLLRHRAESVTLRPGAQQRILRALRSERSPAASRTRLSALWSDLGWPKLAAAGLGALAVLLGLFFLPGVLPRASNTQLGEVEDISPVSIRISYSTPHYTFRQEGNLIIDSLTSRSNFVNVKLSTANTQNHQKRIPL